MSKESIQGPLSALRNAGTVCGVCLARGPEILVNLFPFSEMRMSGMMSAIDDIQRFFRQNGRHVDQMSFGYDGGCVCVVEDDEFRLVVMHMLADEVDFIAKASRAFLADFHLGLFAEQIAAGNTRLEGFLSSASSETRDEEVTGECDEEEGVEEEVDEEEGDEEEGDEEEGDEEGDKASSDEIEKTAVRLSEHQPESTLPEPRVPGSGPS